jgi:hypothetical protein
MRLQLILQFGVLAARIIQNSTNPLNGLKIVLKSNSIVLVVTVAILFTTLNIKKSNNSTVSVLLSGSYIKSSLYPI